jgi:hypothetical protein
MASQHMEEISPGPIRLLIQESLHQFVQHRGIVAFDELKHVENALVMTHYCQRRTTHESFQVNR